MIKAFQPGKHYITAYIEILNANSPFYHFNIFFKTVLRFMLIHKGKHRSDKMYLNIDEGSVFVYTEPRRCLVPGLCLHPLLPEAKR